MTTYVLMTNQTVPSNVANAPAPIQVVLEGNPKRGRITFSLSGPTASFAQAALWAQTALTPYGYTQNVPLLTLNIGKTEPNQISQDLELNMQYYNFLFAELNIIDNSQTVGASMSLVC
jgi:hypothetical protein